MAVEVVLPKVDMDMESGVIAAWKVADGDRVRAGDVLFEMETSKSIMEVEAPASGIVRGLARVDGAAIAVGTRVAWIDDGAGAPDERAIDAPRRDRPPAPSPDAARAHAADAGAAAGDARAQPNATGGAPPAPAQSGPRATPYARRAAREAGVDLASVQGSGPRGRIVADDVAAVARAHEGTTLVPFSLTRRTAARRLVESVRTAPHFYLAAQVEMTALRAALAGRARDIQRASGHAPTLTVAIACVAARVLVRHPLVNASVEGDAARVHAHAHVGVAMEREGDLVVPVLRDADTRSLQELTAEFARLRDAVRAHTIKPGELHGGTFTVSNLGMHGVDAFTAIINPPQSAILAIGRVIDTPVGRDGQVVLRPMATLSLSSDHRIVDGVTAARFMADLRQSIEHPVLE